MHWCGEQSNNKMSGDIMELLYEMTIAAFLMYLLLPPRIMPDVFPEIKAGDGEHQHVLARLKQIYEDLENLVIGLVQFVGVFAPKLL